jgi:NTP pyrophosphatase (non-canonical NTP hydrolase)
MTPLDMDQLIARVIGWAEDRDLLHEENANYQMLKVVEEIGEVAAGLARKDEDAIVDGVGDSLVTLIILSAQLGYSPQECLFRAWEEIKSRTGKTVDGVFIKDE